MSTESKEKPAPRKRRISVPEIAARKGGEPVVCLTAYTTPMARLLDPYCDLLLVGDSMGMVIYGMDSTLGVTLDMSIAHGKAVMAGSSQALVCIDMPFGSYQESPAQAFRNCARVMAETGAQAIKLEGGREMAETIAFLVDRGVPVLAHVGLMPQMVNRAGGYRAQGRQEEDWEPILADARAVVDAGAFATVVEGVAEPLARKLTETTPNVIIGIGASNACDGQILVSEDMLGMFPSAPKFVKKYADLAGEIDKAVKAYADDVRERRFPEAAHTYSMKKPD